MIKAVIFDLDNTLMDFMKMKSMSIDAAIHGMIEAGMSIDFKSSKRLDGVSEDSTSCFQKSRRNNLSLCVNFLSE